MENINEQFKRLFYELDLTDDQAAMIKKLQMDVDAALRQLPVSGRFLPPNEDGYQKCANCGKWNHPYEVVKTCR